MENRFITLEDRERDKRKQTAADLTSFMMHKHYCENDVEAVISILDDRLSWIGPGEAEYASGADTVAGIFRQFAGMVPKCNISDEEYHVIEAAPDLYICTGRMWICTDPSSNMYLQAHQRITTVFRWVNGEPRCCHIHASNPYAEMLEGDKGFPHQIGQQSYEYLTQCIEEQKRKIEAQTELLHRMSFEDSLTGLFNRNRFNHDIDICQCQSKSQLGVACFDLNGLKEVNDRSGHSAGDDLIRRTASHISQKFQGKAYRIGGDEFVVIDEDTDREDFKNNVLSVCQHMEQDHISCSAGFSWRATDCCMKEQFDEADKMMYQKKAEFYSAKNHDRRKR